MMHRQAKDTRELRAGLVQLAFTLAFACVFPACSGTVAPRGALPPEQKRSYEASMTDFDRKATDREAANREAAEKAAKPPRELTTGEKMMSSSTTTTYVIGFPTWTTLKAMDARDRAREERQFVEVNYDVLVQEMAQGQGERLSSFLAFFCWDYINNGKYYGVNSSNPTLEPFRFMVQTDFEALVPAERNPEGLSANVKAEMRRWHVYHKCSL